MRALSISFTALILVATLALAEPAVRVRSLDGVARVELTGSYPQTRYTVFRSPAAGGPWSPVTSFDVLCLGPCLADDLTARSGETYWYRFDFTTSDGGRTSFGPYAVTIPAPPARGVTARVTPNPSRGTATIEVHLTTGGAAASAATRVGVFDLQGRRVRALHDGPLPNGASRLAWDGRDDDGRLAGAGTYFVTVRTPAGESRTRLVRVR